LAEEGSPLAAAQQLSRGIRRQRFAVSLCRRVVDVGWLSGVRSCGCVGRGVWRAPAPVIDEKSTMTNRSTTAPAIMPDCCSSWLAPLMSANCKVRRGALDPANGCSYCWFISPPSPWHIESEGLVLQNSRKTVERRCGLPCLRCPSSGHRASRRHCSSFRSVSAQFPYPAFRVTYAEHESGSDRRKPSCPCA
jgi:hypothetical protein